MKKLPIGNQHLKQFIEDGLIYVDKTPLIYKLLTEGSYYFLSRPRRFGKSLLLDTLKQILLGNQELFKDLWIHDKIEWKKHPVIHLDFSIIAYKAKGLDRALIDELQRIGKEYDVNVDADNCKDALRDLIEGMAKLGKVAVLIDEYDRPITDYITDLSKANEQREILREFYGGLKFLGNKLKILFITGIAKFSKVSLFSVLNNLDDLTIQPTYATLTGITHDELIHYFGAHLQKVADKFSQSVEQVLNNMQKMYDGYSWDGEQFVYNPFSVIKFLKEGIFDNYWFETGTPAFLIEILRHYRVSGEAIAYKEVDSSFFNKFDIRYGIDVYPFLFQTGYSTIKKVKYEDTSVYYTLNYPNQEVQRSFVQNLIEVYTFKPPSVINTATIQLEKALKSRNIKAFEEQLNVLFSDISHHLFPFEKKKKDAQKD